MFIPVADLPNASPERVEVPYRTLLEDEETGRLFEIHRYLFSGGNSAVFEGRELDGEGNSIRTCAIKFQRLLFEKRRRRFENEARIHRDLDHEGIAAFYGYGTLTRTRSVPWIAMDLCGERVGLTAPLTPEVSARTILTVGSALDHIHRRGLIHRDVKPDNVVWKHREDPGGAAVLIDFGIAKYIGEDTEGRLYRHLTEEREFVGPQSFASPELLNYVNDKETPVDLRSDVFGLGLLAWYLATKRIVRGVPSPKADPSGGRLTELLSRSILSEDPDDRPDTAGEAATLIAAALRG